MLRGLKILEICCRCRTGTICFYLVGNPEPFQMKRRLKLFEFFLFAGKTCSRIWNSNSCSENLDPYRSKKCRFWKFKCWPAYYNLRNLFQKVLKWGGGGDSESDSNSASNSAFSPILKFWQQKKFGGSCWHFLLTLKSFLDETTKKAKKTFFKIFLLNYNQIFHPSTVGRSKLLKSCTYICQWMMPISLEFGRSFPESVVTNAWSVCRSGTGAERGVCPCADGKSKCDPKDKQQVGTIQSLSSRGSQRDVVYLGWPKAP